MDVDTAPIMNQSIIFFVSNCASVTSTEKEADDNKVCKVLGPGAIIEAKRQGGWEWNDLS